MPAGALALVLTAALLHAVWNFAAKKAGGDHRFALVSALMVSVLWLPVAAWFGWHELPRWGLAEWSLVLASAVVHLLYFTVLLKGYRVADLTVVYPVARGSGPLLSALGAVLLLGETLSPVGGAGVLAMCGGVFLIAGGPGLWRKAHEPAGPSQGRVPECAARRVPRTPAARARVLAGLRWGALTGALIAGYTVIDGYAVKVLLVGPVLLDYVGNLLRVPFLLPGALIDRAGFAAAWRAQWRHALVVATLGPLAYVLVLYAVTMAPLSHVAPAREVSMLFAALIGGRLLGEGDRTWRLLGAAFIALGVAALALG
jgi:drug/metabolite transporter (DMT)-like permease